jgi:hypothetical protein
MNMGTRRTAKGKVMEKGWIKRNKQNRKAVIWGKQN